MFINEYHDILRPVDDLDIIKLRDSALEKVGILGYSIFTEDGFPICGLQLNDGSDSEILVVKGWFKHRESYVGRIVKYKLTDNLLDSGLEIIQNTRIFIRNRSKRLSFYLCKGNL